jgi:Zn-finger nucleic acid-binding protein
MNELLCKNCKHSFRTLASLPIWGSGAEWRCRKAWVETHVVENLVKGPETIPGYYARCEAVRSRYSDICGKEGRLWTPKSKKFFFLSIKHSER